MPALNSSLVGTQNADIATSPTIRTCESDLGGSFGQLPVKANKNPPLWASLAPDKGRSQLEGIGSTENMPGKQFLSLLTDGLDRQDLQPCAAQGREPHYRLLEAVRGESALSS